MAVASDGQIDAASIESKAVLHGKERNATVFWRLVARLSVFVEGRGWTGPDRRNAAPAWFHRLTADFNLEPTVAVAPMFAAHHAGAGRTWLCLDRSGAA